MGAEEEAQVEVEAEVKAEASKLQSCRARNTTEDVNCQYWPVYLIARRVALSIDISSDTRLPVCFVATRQGAGPCVNHVSERLIDLR